MFQKLAGQRRIQFCSQSRGSETGQLTLGSALTGNVFLPVPLPQSPMIVHTKCLRNALPRASCQFRNKRFLPSPKPCVVSTPDPTSMASWSHSHASMEKVPAMEPQQEGGSVGYMPTSRKVPDMSPLLLPSMKTSCQANQASAVMANIFSAM